MSSTDARLAHNFPVFSNDDAHSVRAVVHRHHRVRSDLLNLKRTRHDDVTVNNFQSIRRFVIIPVTHSQVFICGQNDSFRFFKCLQKSQTFFSMSMTSLYNDTHHPDALRPPRLFLAHVSSSVCPSSDRKTRNDVRKADDRHQKQESTEIHFL